MPQLKPPAANIGNNIRLLRRERGLSQHDLANLAGISRSTIAVLESNTHRNLQISTLQAIAMALGVPVFSVVGAGDGRRSRRAK